MTHTPTTDEWRPHVERDVRLARLEAINAELLEALEAVLPLAESEMDMRFLEPADDMPEDAYEKAEMAVNKARAAIARARGES